MWEGMPIDMTLALAIMAFGVAILIYAWHRYSVSKRIDSANSATNDNVLPKKKDEPPF